ncbi:acyltransferase [Paenibacillus sp. MBLB2552]|uniref:Acyltransferase n=1 Tax=Paenibacillus mellifer TaxID=2937794 RepID=A0A9X1Y2A0_9BACL|nr:acyltransferase [Paenibacillus mellifer]MCK8489624.1 acyltransferase [Paenibacillus mellifer]
MSKVVKERLPQLDIFRALAIISVIQVHASSFAAAEQALNSPVYYFYNWMNIFFKIGTPSFIFLSSFVLFYNYYDQPISRKLVSKFYKKRLTYIILPYVLVSCCYFVLVAIYRHDFINNSKLYELKLLGTALLTGTAYTHLYFVFISIQFYLLFPLFLWLFQSFRNHRVWLALILPCGLALQWGFVFLNKYELQLPNKASYAISYMGYYMLGAILAIYFGKVKAWLSTEWKALPKLQKGWTAALWIGWLVIALIHVQLWYSFRQGLSSPNSLWFELLWNVHSLFSALVLMKAAFYIQRKGSGFWIRSLTRLGELSFGIYLFHPFILLVYRLFWSEQRLPGASLGYLLYIVVGSLGALFLSWGFVQFSFRRLPFAAWFLGNVPASLRKNKTSRRRESGQSSSVGANM